MAERVMEAERIEFQEPPKKVKFPLSFQRHESFTSVAAKVQEVIGSLPRHQQKQLRDFTQTLLHPGVLKGKVPHIHSSPQKLMQHVMQYCDSLNLDLLKMIIDYLKNDGLTRQLQKCERTLSEQMQQATWDAEVDVAPPPGCKVILAKMKKKDNTTVREAVEVQQLLAEYLKFGDQPSILRLAGLANDSLVYIWKEHFGPVLQTMHQKIQEVLARGVEVITFDKQAKLDTETREITFHPDVPKIDPAAECPEFGILVIGETGSGKSTLINNLLGKDVAIEGHTSKSETKKIKAYRGKAKDVPITLYDTPGLDGLTSPIDKNICQEIKKLIKSKKVCFTVFCFPISERRIQQSHVLALQAYHEAKVDWDRAIVALTFADSIRAPRHERKMEGFNEAAWFQQMLDERKSALRDVLVQNVGVPPAVAKKLIMRPTIDDWKEKLLNEEEWFIPLWQDILNLLEPAAYFRFLEIHRDNITFENDIEKSISCGPMRIPITGEHKDRFMWIRDNKLKIASEGTGGFAVLLVAGGIAGIVTGAVLGATVGFCTCGAGSLVCLAGVAAGCSAIAIGVYCYKQRNKEYNY